WTAGSVMPETRAYWALTSKAGLAERSVRVAMSTARVTGRTVLVGAATGGGVPPLLATTTAVATPAATTMPAMIAATLPPITDPAGAAIPAAAPGAAAVPVPSRANG